MLNHPSLSDKLFRRGQVILNFQASTKICFYLKRARSLDAEYSEQTFRNSKTCSLISKFVRNLFFCALVEFSSSYNQKKQSVKICVPLIIL